jgi:hypothetical protein
MASKDRVYTLNEARSEQPAAAPANQRRERARVLAGDPPWLHDGLTVRLTLRGEPVDFFGIGVMARGVGRSPGSLRRWIGEGIIPETPYRTRGRIACAQHRLWTREAVLAMSAAVQELGLHGRRPRRWAGSELPEVLRATLATA